jgi:hypothetical protein
MNTPHKKPGPPDEANNPPPQDEVDKQVQREKAEVKEVAGRHKNDGALNQKGRQ